MTNKDLMSVVVIIFELKGYQWIVNRKKKQEKALLSLLELWLYSEAILPIWRTEADKTHAVVDRQQQAVTFVHNKAGQT